MSKTIAYIAAAVVFLGIGALTAGLIVWYTYPQNNDVLPNEARIAKCELQSVTPGSVSGIITFNQTLPDQHVKVTGTITGLSNGKHGFHIHTYGVTGNACSEAKGHYNPGGFNHAAPNDTERHVGDLGNIISDQNTADVMIEDKVITLWGQRSIVGRSIVVHEGEDDLGKGPEDSDTLNTGNAGPRVACCNIYLTAIP